LPNGGVVFNNQNFMGGRHLEKYYSTRVHSVICGLKFKNQVK